jgi:signal transduction histidine kinase
MQVVSPIFIGLVVAVLWYAILFVAPLFPIRATKQTRLALSMYAGISTLFTLNLLSLQQNMWHGNAYTLAISAMLYQPFVQSIFFLYLTHTFLHIETPNKKWWQVATAWLLLPFIPFFLPFRFPEPIIGQFGLIDLAAVILVFGWTTFIFAAVSQTFSALRRLQQPLHRNRHTYWVIAIVFLTAGDILFFPAGQLFLSLIFKFVALGIIAYVLFTYKLADVWVIFRRALSYLILITLGVGIFVFGFYLYQYFEERFAGIPSLLIATIIFLILASFITPLLRFIDRLVNFLLSNQKYDPNRLVRNYSKSISNIVDLQRLEATAVELVSQAMGVHYGALLLVDQSLNEQRQLGYEVRSVQSYGKQKVVLGFLPSNSPVIEFWREERRPLTQFEIDMSPRFHEISSEEYNWLNDQNIDVYVPIFSQDKWIGLLTMGPKESRQRYYDQDLYVLSLMADQTAVALENARLVEDLVHLTDNLTEAFHMIERSNERLREMDELKSSFLGVITHELRTPFANLTFSKQLFERYGLDKMEGDQAEVWENLATGIDESKKLVDNLVNFASFLGKQGVMQFEKVQASDILESAMLPLRPLAMRKGLCLQVNGEEGVVKMPAFTADKSRLTDAIHHLIHNAIKFTNQGHIEIQTWTENERFYFEIRDTGEGIPSAELTAIWQGFTQMADALKRGAEGLGLGLALVKAVITAHGGQVSVESVVGEGSCFRFWIPCQQAEVKKFKQELSPILNKSELLLAQL